MEQTIVIDAQSHASPFPHFWEHMFGSCHASTTLCEDWRKDLRALKEIVDVKYVPRSAGKEKHDSARR
jgi:xylan 1,4-beta-xylosidase